MAFERHASEGEHAAHRIEAAGGTRGPKADNPTRPRVLVTGRRRAARCLRRKSAVVQRGDAPALPAVEIPAGVFRVRRGPAFGAAHQVAAAYLVLHIWPREVIGALAFEIMVVER